MQSGRQGHFIAAWSQSSSCASNVYLTSHWQERTTRRSHLHKEIVSVVPVISSLTREHPSWSCFTPSSRSDHHSMQRLFHSEGRSWSHECRGGYIARIVVGTHLQGATPRWTTCPRTVAVATWLRVLSWCLSHLPELHLCSHFC